MTWTIDAICVGRVAALGPGGSSAIAKRAVPDAVGISIHGIDGDQQADKRHHGGPDMAVHQYPYEHHQALRRELGDHALWADRGAFGSNLSMTGLTEQQVHLGDRFRLGTVLLEACQPRQPCATIEKRFGRKGMVKAILANGSCGWFYRVIEEGRAQAGDTLERVETGDTDWTMAAMFGAIWGSDQPRDLDLIARIADHPLAPVKLSAKLRSKYL